jgi:hypothetical protein
MDPFTKSIARPDIDASASTPRVRRTKSAKSNTAPAMVVLRIALLVICAALLTAAVVATYRSYANGNVTLFVDWVTYAHASARLLAGQSLYAAQQTAGPYHLPDLLLTGYAYPPPSALFFAPFSFGDAGLFAWLVLNVVLLLSGLAAVLRRELGSIQPVSLGLVLAGLSVPLPRDNGLVIPFADGVVNANVNVALAGVVAWAWALYDRDRWLPFAAALGGIVKIFPAGLSLWSARRGGWRPILVTAAVGLSLVALTLPVTGVNEWIAFTRALGNAVPSCTGRLSVACALGPWVGQGTATWIAVGLGGALLLGSLVVRSEVAAFTLLVLGMLAPVTDGHPHYLLFVYVLLVIVTVRSVRVRRSRNGA